MSRSIDLIVVHCSATRPSLDVRAVDIDRWHRARGWSCIGYHYVITRSGGIERGRDEGEVGAHVQGHNATSIGICLIGGISEDGKQAENNYTRDQWIELASLLRELVGRYPRARICGHRDLSPDADGDGIVEPNEWLKQCPCFDVAQWVESAGIVQGG